MVSHYEREFSSLEFPQLSSAHLYRRRSRPFTINVEGIVGTGKSTFLTFFQVCAVLLELGLDTGPTNKAFTGWQNELDS